MVDSRPQWLAALRKIASSAVPEDVRDNPPVVPTFGTVRSLDPLRIALDSDPATTLPYAPACLKYPTFVGQRVWALTYGRQVVIVGVLSHSDAGPGPTPVWTDITSLGANWTVYSGDHPKFIVIDGIVYLTGRVGRSGTPTAGENVLSVPSPGRPSSRMLFGVPSSDSSGVISFGALDFRNTGSVEYRGGSTTWMSLAGIVYPQT